MKKTQTEVTKTTTPTEDAKANSDSVPDVSALNGQFERVVALRFKYQADPLAGMGKMIKEQNIHSAVILAVAGSLTGYHFHLVSNRTFPSKNLLIKNPSAPADPASMNGCIIDGRIHRTEALLK